MRKLKRRKLIKEFLEERIAKNARRIQAISKESFTLRMQLEALNATPATKPLTKEGREALEKAKEQAIVDAALAAEQGIAVDPAAVGADKTVVQEIVVTPEPEVKPDALH